MPDLSFAMNLPPEKALEYFRGKENAKDKGWNWQEVWQEEHAKTFTVAKCVKADILQDLRTALDQAMAKGETFEQFRKNLEPTLRAKGWWGKQIAVDAEGNASTIQLGSPYRLRNIYRTNLQTAYMAGRYREQMDEVEDRPYWQYVAIRDSRTRPAHLAMDGRVYRWDDPIWGHIYPPNDWGCRCRVRTLDERGLTRKGLTVEKSWANLTRPEQKNPSTGETLPRTVYRIPGRRETFSPGWGWDYNPGRTNWHPDLDKYSPDIQRQYLKTTYPEFLKFIANPVEGVNIPVGLLSDEVVERLGSETRIV